MCVCVGVSASLLLSVWKGKGGRERNRDCVRERKGGRNAVKKQQQPATAYTPFPYFFFISALVKLHSN